MALSCKCYDAFPPSLADFSERLQRTNRGARAEFLGKLASRCLLRVIRDLEFALRDRPGLLS